MRENHARLLILPVRRVLMSATLAYLAGIYLSPCFVFPAAVSGVICAVLLGLSACRAFQRKSAVFYMMAVFLLLGNGLAGHELLLRDTPTGSGAWIEGTVSAIERPYRIFLRDVTVDNERVLHRDAVVTLMLDEGSQTPTPEVGQRVSGKGRLFAPDEPRNPGGTNWRYRALADGYELSGYLLSGWKAEGERGFSISEMFRRCREALLAHIGRIFGERAALFQGIMLGDRSALEEDFTRSMQLTGTAHILTVSGLHLSMIAYAMSQLLDRTAMRRRNRLVALSMFLAAFTGLTGCAAGTVRAMIMALLRELARVRGRRYEPLTALSCAALLMTLFNPVWALDASFQFSFFVVLGIILLAGGVAQMRSRRRQTLSRLRSVTRRLFSVIGVSACAQISALPMQLLLYGYVPLLSLPMNLLCGTLMPVLMLLGWAGALCGLVCEEVGRLIAGAAAWPAALFETVSLWIAQFPFAIVRLPAPYPAAVFLFAALMMLVSVKIRFGSLRRLTACGLAAAIALSYIPRFNPQPAYVQLDVGQGDASLFRFGREAVIVDVGPADSYDLLRYLRHEGLHVKAVLLSHLDEDHAGAIAALLNSEVDVPVIVTAARAMQEETTQEILQAIEQAVREKSVLLREVRPGDLLETKALSMRVLSPDDAIVGSNERSLVLHAQMEGVSFLLTGDLTAKSEPANLPPSDVLKVAHHGSKSSTSNALLAQVRPKLALISVGADNWYGHPSKAVLERLDAVGAKTLRTDELGCITLRLKAGRIRTAGFLQTNAFGLYYKNREKSERLEGI